MHIQVADVQTWLDSVKAQITSIDPTMEQHISGYTLGRLLDTFDDPTFGVPTWVDYNSTPLLVRQCIAMLFAAWFYDRQYSEVASQGLTHTVVATSHNGSTTIPIVAGTPYGLLLRTSAETLLEGIISGSILLQEIQPNAPAVLPEFYPTDASSTSDAVENNTDPDDNSLGPSMFGVSKVF